MIALYMLGWLWSLPTTLIGLLVACVGARPYLMRRGGWIWTARPWLEAFMHSQGIGGVTLGTVIVLQPWEVRNVDVVIHELTHVKQAMILGPLFLPAYLLGFVLGGFSYERNPFEVAAFKAAGEPLD